MKERQQIEATLAQLRDTLPEGWEVDAKLEPSPPSIGGPRPDAIIELRAPDGTVSRLALEAKAKALEARDVERLAGQLATGLGGAGLAALGAFAGGLAFLPGGLPIAGALVTAAFISPRARKLLAKLGIGYADRTGNLRLQLNNPAVFLQQIGDDRNPDREPRPLRSLKGPAAGRVARALCDFIPPYGIRELAGRAGAALGTTVRVVEFLDQEAIVERTESRGIGKVDWVALVKRWSEDRGESGLGPTFRDPMGFESLLDKLREAKLEYSITGSFAAAQIAPIAPPRLLTMYVSDPKTAAERLDLQEAPTGANVMLVEPFDSVVFDRSWKQKGVVYAALSQVATDLLIAPGRGPEIAKELISWMQTNEQRWRIAA